MAKYVLKQGHTRTFLMGVPRRSGEYVEIKNLDMLTDDEKQTLIVHFDIIGQDGERQQVVIEKTKENPGGNHPGGKKDEGNKPATLPNGLTPEQARMKLIAAGITLAENISDDKLQDLFDKTFSANAPDPKNQKPKKKDEGNKPETLPNGLTPEQAREKLISAGIVFADSIPDDELFELYSNTFAAQPGDGKNK